MSALRDLQAAFAAALLDASGAGVLDRVRDAAPPGAARLEIYRNNVRTTYRGALREVYPAVDRLVGEAFFGYAAHRYALEVPSTSGDVRDYGEAFAALLGRMSEAVELPYLPDVARLEWAWHQVFHAPDARPLDPARLAAVPPDRQDRIRFRLAPAVRLVRSAYPVLRIWEIAQPGFAGDDEVDLASGPDRLLVARTVRRRVEIVRLGAGEHALLEAFAVGAPLAASLAAALAAEADFDAGRALAAHVARGTIAGLDA